MCVHDVGIKFNILTVGRSVGPETAHSSTAARKKEEELHLAATSEARLAVALLAVT